MTIPIIQVDAFTATPFHGNPAAVCVLPAAADAAWMQQVAREMNLSETAFVVRREDGDFDLRWFTPLVEVDLCGHATLATAHVLWQAGHLEAGAQARFHTRSGLLTANQDQDWIILDFPATPPEVTEPPAGLAYALGVELVAVARSKFDYLVEVEHESLVRHLRPNFSLLRDLPVRGIMVTSRGTEPYDFVSRFFAPAVGVDEDPVTGSAHCCLTPYWSAKLERSTFLAYQASPRGGTLRVELRGDRVLLAGQAVTVLRGELV
ncbi:PhzF family phenazine biosynthesis protein [Candidatus Oscillochloris fontis]|uniref:PhzF family phenazine biosynthesis protein n=1 Tax=Candidatus Oscillochloris fontis TaxID=2496868 RepID=UPI00101C682C|nr:PhzF family phenazine biosynthesis protein [Candidatus Oscillochloris fontis]